MRVEAELKNLLAEHRQESLGHTPTHWDDSTGFLLMPFLAAHEQDALTGQCTAQDDFQQCIRRSIPSGCTFKGFPQHHRYRLTCIGCQRVLQHDMLPASCWLDHAQLPWLPMFEVK